jgi:hypothetical protein
MLGVLLLLLPVLFASDTVPDAGRTCNAETLEQSYLVADVVFLVR